MSARDVIVKWWLGSNGLEGSTPRWTSAAIENTDAILSALDAAGYAPPMLATELERLQNSEVKLTALENNGVDNWDFYSDAMEEAHAEIARRKTAAKLSETKQKETP